MGTPIDPVPNCPPLTIASYPGGTLEQCENNCVAGAICGNVGWFWCDEGPGVCNWMTIFGWCTAVPGPPPFLCNCFPTYTSITCTAGGSFLPLEPAGFREPMIPINKDVPRLLLFDYNLCDKPGSMMDCHIRNEDNRPVLKFCNPDAPMNLKVLFDPDIFFP